MPLARFFQRHGWLVAIAAAYLYVFPYYPRLRSANELPRAYQVMAIADDHTFAIDRGVREYGPTSDLALREGHYYPNKAPGASLVVVPFYLAVEAVAGRPSLAATMWLSRVVTGVIPSLAFLVLLWGFLGRIAPDERTRRLVLVAYALGSMALPYSLLFFSHQLSAVCIASAWILAGDVAAHRRGLGAMAAAGLLAGMAPLVDYQTAFIGVPLAIHVIWQLRAWPRRELARAIAIAVATAAAPIAILLAYHAACFGSPLSTGYNYATTYATDHDHGLLGMTVPTARAFVGVTVAPDNGFFALAPWWLLAIPGGVVLWRRGERALVATCASVAAIFFYFVSSLGFWRAGWEVGPRYIVALQPFLLPLVAAALASWQGRPRLLGAAAGLVLAGVAIYVLAVATLPYWPDAVDGGRVALRDPLYEVAFRLLRDGAFAPNLGHALGLPALAGIAPFALGAVGLAAWAIARVATVRGLALAVAVAALVLAAFAAVPRTGPAAERAYAQTLYPAVTR